eukprot:6991339-Ditylum_brightwellii.AAC.1
MNKTPSISKVVDGTNNLDLESNKNNEGDDLTVLSGLTMDEPPNIQNNIGNQDEQNKEHAHQDFQQGGANVKLRQQVFAMVIAWLGEEEKQDKNERVTLSSESEDLMD